MEALNNLIAHANDGREVMEDWQICLILVLIVVIAILVVAMMHKEDN